MGYLFLMFCLPFILYSSEAKLPWLVYYNAAEPKESLEPYNPIIFHSAGHPSLQPLLKKNKEVLGYLNLGEVEIEDPWFEKVHKQGIVIKQNPIWPNSFIVDIRNAYWKDLILNEIAPKIFEQGFTGLFLDQLDVALDLEKEKNYQGMKEAAIDLIKSLRKKYPDKRLMMNRAYQILPDVGRDIDYELAETLYSSYNFETKQYNVRPKEEFEWQLAQVNSARTNFPHLVIFSLDYWGEKDPEMVRKIYTIERSHCLRPYVGTIELNKVILDPS